MEIEETFIDHLSDKHLGWLLEWLRAEASNLQAESFNCSDLH